MRKKALFIVIIVLAIVLAFGLFLMTPVTAFAMI
jgi:hypothetical protein